MMKTITKAVPAAERDPNAVIPTRILVSPELKCEIDEFLKTYSPYNPLTVNNLIRLATHEFIKKNPPSHDVLKMCEEYAYKTGYRGDKTKIQIPFTLPAILKNEIDTYLEKFGKGKPEYANVYRTAVSVFMKNNMPG